MKINYVSNSAAKIAVERKRLDKVAYDVEERLLAIPKIRGLGWFFSFGVGRSMFNVRRSFV